MSAMQRYLATSGRAEGELSAITMGDRESLESQLQGQLGLAQDQVGLGQEKLTRDLVEGEVGIAGLGTIKSVTKGIKSFATTGAQKINNIANVYEKLGGNPAPLNDIADTLNRGSEAITSSSRNVFDTLSRQRAAPTKVVREDGQAINPSDLTQSTSVDSDLVPLPKGKAPAQTPDYASLDEPARATDLDALTGRPLAARETMADLGKGLPDADVEGLEDEQAKIDRIDPNLREYPSGGDGYGGRSTLDVDEPGAAVERAPLTGYELAGSSADIQSGIADAIAGRRRPPAAKPPQEESPSEELPFPEVEEPPQQAQASSVDDMFAQARARSQAKADAITTDPEDPGSAPNLLARPQPEPRADVGGGNEGQVEGDLAEREAEEPIAEEGSSIFGNLFKGGIAEGLGTVGEIASGIGDVALLGTGIKDLIDSKKMFSEQEDQYNKEKSALSSMGTQPQEGTGEIAMGVFDSSAEPISDATFSHF